MSAPTRDRCEHGGSFGMHFDDGRGFPGEGKLTPAESRASGDCACGAGYTVAPHFHYRDGFGVCHSLERCL